MNAGRVLVAGCGDLGTRAALRFAARGYDVAGLRRSNTPLPAPIESIRADLSNPVALPGRFTHVVITLTPDGRDEAAYRATYVDAVRNLLGGLEGAPRVLFVSSTSVWGDHGGDWVDERTPPRPDAFNGRVLIDAEAAIDGTILRLAGIYGPGRTSLVERVRSGAPASDEWTNRIHVDDAAEAIVHLSTLASPDRCYVGVDREPARAHDVADFIARRLGLPCPPRVEGRQNKRLSGALLAATGFALRFPDFRSGYTSLV